jgi:cell division protein FtsA
MASKPRISRLIGAINVGSFRISAMVAGVGESGELTVLGSSHRAAQGIKRGYVADMAAATYAIRDAVEKAEKLAGATVSGLWLSCSGAGLASRIASVEIEMGGRRVEEEDLESLLVAGRDALDPDGRMVLHAQPAFYTLDGMHGVANPVGLHADRLGVDIHVVMADGAPVRNLKEAVQNAHFEVEGIVASPLAAGYACLAEEERELGVAMIEMGAEVTQVAVYAAGMMVGLETIQRGGADITDAIASAFGIRRFQAERIKCFSGSAIASPQDNREVVPVDGPEVERGSERTISRADLVSVITGQLDLLFSDIGKSLDRLGFASHRDRQVVVTGGASQLAGIADYAQAALGRPVRAGKPAMLPGLPEAHSVAGFSTLAGLVLYAVEDPVDVRSVGPATQVTSRFGPGELAVRLFRALRDNF